MLGVGVFLLAVATIVSLAGTIMVAVAAFRVSLVWGLLVLFVPFAGLVFLIKYWAQAKRGFLVGLAGSAIAVLGFVTFSAGVASKAQAQFGALAAQMQSEMKRQMKTATPSVSLKTATPAVAGREQAAEPIEPAPAGLPKERGLAVRPVETSRGLPDVPPDLSNPNEIRTRDLGRHVGEELLFVEKDGDSVWGKLVSVGSYSLRIERRLHGGSVQYDVSLGNIRTVRTDG